jgi:hypothetical protein
MNTDIASYHRTNPDPIVAGCRATGREEDGVIFPAVEPMEGIYTYIGRTAMIEGIGSIFNLNPKQVVERLSDEAKPQDKIRALEAEVTRLKEKLAQREAYFDALRDQGFIAPDIE